MKKRLTALFPVLLCLFLLLAGSESAAENIPGYVVSWNEQGIEEDPTPQRLQHLREVSFEEVKKFYEVTTQGSSLVITVAGDKKRMNLQQLGGKFTIIEVKVKDIMR